MILVVVVYIRLRICADFELITGMCRIRANVLTVFPKSCLGSDFLGYTQINTINVPDHDPYTAHQFYTRSIS